MITSKFQEMNSWLTSRITASEQEIQTLNKDGRTDEAVFARVRMNIWGIFKAVLQAAGDDERKAAEFFLVKLEQIPKNWHTSLLAAEAHGDTEKAHIEQIKLDAAAEIRNAFLQIWEVEA